MRTVLTVLLILFAPAVTASELRITVEGICSTQGTILIGLYDSLKTFTRAIKLSDTEGSVSFRGKLYKGARLTTGRCIRRRRSGPGERLRDESLFVDGACQPVLARMLL
jgi:hypothetical protein